MIKRGRVIKGGVFMKCLGKLLSVLMISVFLFGCELYEEGKEIFVPFEEIVVEKGEEAGLAVLDSLRERVVLEAKGLPVLDQDNVYEAWLVDRDIDLKISIGTFRVDENGNYILDVNIVKEDILDTDAVMITLEPVPDVDSGPSDEVVLQGDTGGVADVMSLKLEAVEKEEEELLEELEELIEIELPEVEKVLEEVPEELPEEEVVEEVPEEVAVEVPEEVAEELLAEIKILVRSFDPEELIVAKGTTVKWTNNAPGARMVGGDVRGLRLESGESFEYTFEEAGEYSIMEIISKARGTIIITDIPEEVVIPEEVEEVPEEVVEEEVPEEVPEEVEEVPEVVEEEKPAVVIIIQETETVSLKTTATDPDADLLAYAYSSPLDEDGEWKTTYGDAGEYTVTVTVSDAQLSTSEDVLIIVNKKEEAPVIDEFSPLELELETDENTRLEFSASASDINKDELTYSWELDGSEISTAKKAVYDASYDDAGTHELELEVTDGVSVVGKEWKITVNNVNRKPVLEAIADITVKETETVKIEPKASDPDDDALSYTISDPVGDDGKWQTTYDDAGEYAVLVTVTDGVDSDLQEVKITVQNVNRPPVIEEIVNKG